MTIHFLSQDSRLQDSLDCCGGHLESGNGRGCQISFYRKNDYGVSPLYNSDTLYNSDSDGWGTGLGYGSIKGGGEGLGEQGYVDGNGTGSTGSYYTYDDGDGGDDC
jgi:hypothetical protein